VTAAEAVSGCDGGFSDSRPRTNAS